MTRLAETIGFLHFSDRVDEAPSLRAALRLARAYGGDFRPLLSSLAEGDTIAIGRVFGECVSSSGALPDLFTVPGTSLAARIAELQPIAFELVAALLGVDPDEPEERPASPSAKPQDAPNLVEQYETLFAFATGILKWAPETAWKATPEEIVAAMQFRAKVFNPKPDPKASKPHGDLTLNQQADLLAANLMARYGKKPDAE